MNRERPPLDRDPPRWIERGAGDEAEDRAAERLRGALELPVPEPRHLRELPARRSPRLLLPVARLCAVLLAGMGIGVAGAAVGRFARRVPAAVESAPREDRLDVAAGGSARWHRSGRWRLALAGPGTARMVDGESGRVQLAAGTLTVAAEAVPVTVEAGGGQYLLAPGAVARVAVSAEGRPEAIALAGQVVASSALSTRDATERERALARDALGDAPPAARAPEPAPVAAAQAPPAPVSRREPPTAPRPRAAVAAEPEPMAAVPADVAPPAWPEPAAAGNADSEAQWLGRALTRLRRDGDPGAALALLEQHAARFPASALVAEATAIRVEALLARGDEAAALAALEALPAARAPLDRRLQASRGELRAKAGRCADAAHDFSAVLHAAPSDAVDERALRGRAACAALAGDQASLRADLTTYLDHFADRPFAPEARARLEAVRP